MNWKRQNEYKNKREVLKISYDSVGIAIGTYIKGAERNV